MDEVPFEAQSMDEQYDSGDIPYHTVSGRMGPAGSWGHEDDTRDRSDHEQANRNGGGDIPQHAGGNPNVDVNHVGRASCSQEGESNETSPQEGAKSAALDAERMQYMTSALSLQRAACVNLVGQEAFHKLYELLKASADSKDVDEMDVNEMARLVFGIIPYEKADVLPLLYKLLYLEAQIEAGEL